MKHETLGQLPAAALALVKRSLAGEQFVSATERRSKVVVYVLPL